MVEARDLGFQPSRLMAATPYEILNFIGRGVSLRDYDRLKAALDRLQSTTIATSIRQPTERRLHRFSWINEWKERADGNGRPLGLRADPAGLVLQCGSRRCSHPHYRSRVLRAHRRTERWLYRLVRKHGGRQHFGWSFDLAHLHAKSGSLSPLKHFAYDLREIVRRQSLPGYRLAIEEQPRRGAVLRFVPVDGATLADVAADPINPATGENL